MENQKREFKIGQLIFEDKEWEDMVTDIHLKSSCLFECRDAFLKNMRRLQFISLEPAISQMALINNIHIQTLDMVEGTSRTEFEPKELLDWKLSETGLQKLNEFVGKLTQERYLQTGFVLRFVVQQIEYNAQKDIENSAFGQNLYLDWVESLLNSVVLQSYLFFEALAGDLWCAAGDSPNSSISGRLIQNKKWSSGKSDMLASKIPPETAAMAISKPASYRRAIGMVSFQKLGLIKDYFEIAFGSEVRNLFDDVAGGYIHALNAFRNCIAHSAGKVDRDIKEKMQRFPRLAPVIEGEFIKLDGEIVKQLRNASAALGIALLKYVDEELQKDQ